MIHHLKVWREFWPEIKSGAKPFEVRRDDRSYRAGDILRMRSYDPASRGYEFPYDEYIDFVITFKLPGGQFGIEPGFCVLGIRPVDAAEGGAN